VDQLLSQKGLGGLIDSDETRLAEELLCVRLADFTADTGFPTRRGATRVLETVTEEMTAKEL